jgi:hypothetical protein
MPTDGRTDAHDEANTRFSKLREREQKQTGNDVEGSNPGIFLKKISWNIPRGSEESHEKLIKRADLRATDMKLSNYVCA